MRPASELKEWLKKLIDSNRKEKEDDSLDVSRLIDLLVQMLLADPAQRISTDKALKVKEQWLRFFPRMNWVTPHLQCIFTIC